MTHFFYQRSRQAFGVGVSGREESVIVFLCAKNCDLNDLHDSPQQILFSNMALQSALQSEDKSANPHYDTSFLQISNKHQ